MAQKAGALKSLKPDLDVTSIPSYAELISGPENNYVYGKTWDEAMKDPIVALQTSGTTGNPPHAASIPRWTMTGPPKVVILTNEFLAVVDNHHYLAAPPGRDKFAADSLTGRYYPMFPSFHVSIPRPLREPLQD
jgi:hypothetical protein